MARFIKIGKGNRGLKPGSLVFVGEQKIESVKITAMRYDRKKLEEYKDLSIDEAFSLIDEQQMTWINIFGLHDTEMISRIGAYFSIDDLVLEDILNTDHRPRFNDEYNKLTFIAKFVNFDTETAIVTAEQLSMIVGKNYVITLQERPARHFESVRERIRKSPDRVRIIHSDYLAYALMDCIVDAYMDIVAELGSKIDGMERQIFENKSRDTSQQLYRLRTELNYLRRIVIPLRELTLAFLRSGSPLVRKETRDFITDMNDHLVIIAESIEVYYSLVSDQIDMYNTSISNRANEIMKVLTVFAALFIPLTFIAGIYGMNFKHIPELEMKHGYLYFWSLILVVAVVLIIYFRRKKWL